ncbi:hypothetical protein ABIA38_005210 [Embleya sp. AB8]
MVTAQGRVRLGPRARSCSGSAGSGPGRLWGLRGAGSGPVRCTWWDPRGTRSGDGAGPDGCCLGRGRADAAVESVWSRVGLPGPCGAGCGRHVRRGPSRPPPGPDAPTRVRTDPIDPTAARPARPDRPGPPGPPGPRVAGGAECVDARAAPMRERGRVSRRARLAAASGWWWGRRGQPFRRDGGARGGACARPRYLENRPTLRQVGVLLQVAGLFPSIRATRTDSPTRLPREPARWSVARCRGRSDQLGSTVCWWPSEPGGLEDRNEVRGDTAWLSHP